MQFIRARQKTNTLFVISILLITVITLANFLHFRRFRASAQEVIHTQNVLRTLAGLYSGIQDAETGQRGYLLTNNPGYLVPFQNGKIVAEHFFEEAKHLTQGNAEQGQALDRVKIRMEQKFQELNLTVEFNRRHQMARAQDIVRSNAGEILMNEIRREIFAMEDRERDIFSERQKKLNDQTAQRMWLLFTGSALTLGLLFWMFYLLTYEINERQRSQEALEKSKLQLIAQTLELTAANKELEAFSYSVSHDLRAPLRGIGGFSQLVQEKYAHILDDEGRGYLERVHKGIQRMGQLIDDLIKLARIARAELDLQPVDLSLIARDVILEIQSGDSSRRVEWVLPSSLLAVGDPRLLHMVYENLLGNAWKFCGRQEQTRVEIGVQDEAGERIYFVRDNGAGFDMTYVDKLFTAFQRLHSASEFPGTGIGLATVNRIIQRHGGRIWAQSAVGQGSTFYFTLGGRHVR